MVSYFNQFVGETRDYQQAITDDTIVTSVWTCDPGGTVQTLVNGAGGTSTTGRLTTSKPGRLTLRATITCASGQTVIGEARISVLS